MAKVEAGKIYDLTYGDRNSRTTYPVRVFHVSDGTDPQYGPYQYFGFMPLDPKRYSGGFMRFYETPPSYGGCYGMDEVKGRA